MKKSTDQERKPLESLLERRGISRKQLARESGVSYDSLSSYVIGRREPTLSTAVLLCKTLRCSLKDLCIELGIDVSGIPDG